ncbi:STE/STE20/FRAY protein kinase [Puccinia triticina 1-1 BBBD Race 1]|uniref:Protein kinase domain-containing protein n=1 Tax=Puccinia triticina (isolate 1-1 / race 1 (BBBD)) TaxID=630390 RepID=A0A0C4F461_PUCT1|nr:STE/STE20/FRAY protein kinase [Puccinia triticina 1-1 BBBD Race 1]
MLGALGLGQKKARTKNLKLTKTLSNCSTTSASTTLTAVSSCPSTARKTVRGTRSLFSRLSATYQTITHLSSSFTDSLHSNATSCPSNPASVHPSCPSPLDTNQSDYNELSSHRRRILGSVTDQWPMYSSDPQDYLLGAHIGSGASSVVRLAHFKPRPGELCAVKVIDIDRLSVKQIEYLRRETLLMSLAKHPNVLRVRGEWIEESSLCIAMRLMQAGSIADLLRFRFQDGLPEPVIASVLIQAIAGLDYLHANGWIHRDLKAANLLLDHDGTVLLADFGVSIDRPCDPAPPASTPLLTRQTSFVGTALFMAPEVVTRQPYNDRADIWSFGITALEMAVGKAPYATISPARVLMKTVQEPSPTLDRRRAGAPYEYSKAFQRFVDRCLSKDPALRPTARQLLCKEKFFRQARPKAFLLQTILADLPPLALRQERRFFAPPNSRIPHPVDNHLLSPVQPPLPCFNNYQPPRADDHASLKASPDQGLDSPSSSSSACPPWDFSSVSRPHSFASSITNHSSPSEPTHDTLVKPPPILSRPSLSRLNTDARPNVFDIVDSFNLHPAA